MPGKSIYSNLAVAAALTLLGSPAFAWSALQHDCAEDVDNLPTHNLYKEFMDKIDMNPQDAQSSDAAAKPEADNATSADAAKAAQAAIENDASSEPTKAPLEETARAQSEDNKASTEQEATPRPRTAVRVAGKQPNESINDANYFCKRSQEFCEKGDYQSALNYVNKALELNPECWDAWYQKALTYQLSGYDAAAARRYLALLERRPDMVAAHVALGSLYRKHKNYSLAEGEYTKAIDLNWRCFVAHYNLANVYMDEAKADHALKEYQFCLKLDKSNAQVHNNIGVIYQKRNYLEEALTEFTAASHLAPANKSFADNVSSVKTKLSEKPTKVIKM